MLMKTLLMIIASLVLLVSPTHGQTITCTCTEVGGDGIGDCGRMLRYTYQVDPQGKAVILLTIGTEDGDETNYHNICMPDGWLFDIGTGGEPGGSPHAWVATPHGGAAPTPGDDCPFQIGFAGPPFLMTPFTFGFDHAGEAHTVTWHMGWTGGSGAADWGQPVGLGQGPIHAPSESAEWRVPGLTTWGIIILVMLLLLAGAYTVRVRRATA